MIRASVRLWVREALKTILKGEDNQLFCKNMRIINFPGDDFWSSEVALQERKDGEWKNCKSFRFTGYFSNYWNMVTDPWICDMINDITDEAMKYIDETKEIEIGW